jgi:hypothetical protein
VTNVFWKILEFLEYKKFKSCYKFGKKVTKLLKQLEKKEKKTGPAYNEDAPIVGWVCCCAPGIKDHLTRLVIIFLY